MNLEDYSFCGFKLYMLYGVKTLVQFKDGVPWKQWVAENDEWGEEDLHVLDDYIFLNNVDECEVFGMLL
tara:strand:- start:389 stop:595 length:207 start_codon:yes stop_codon:yes gene_type:complete